MFLSEFVVRKSIQILFKVLSSFCKSWSESLDSFLLKTFWEWVLQVLWCLFTASISWMIKILVVKVAASNFHRTAYFEKIQECLFNQYLLEKLSGPPTMANFETEDGHKNSSVGSKHRKNQRGLGGSLRNEETQPQKELLKTQSESHLPQGCSLEESSTVASKSSLNSKITGYWQKGCQKFGNERTHHSVIDIDAASHVPNAPKQDDIHFVPQMPNLGKSAKTLQHEKLQGLTPEVSFLVFFFQFCFISQIKTFTRYCANKSRHNLIVAIPKSVGLFHG